MSERMEFLRDRQRGMGGTDMARILGVHPSGEDALDVYFEKTRPIDPGAPEPPPNIHQLRGRVSEATIAGLYFEKTGRRGRKAPAVFTHPDFPAFRCHLDYEIFADPTREPEWTRGTGVMEVKAPTASVFARIYDRGMRLSETVQVQTYTAVSRRTWGSFAFGNLEHSAGPVLPGDVKADPQLGAFLLEVGQRFWDEHVVPRIPPDVTEWSGLLQDPDTPPVLEAAGTLEVVEDDAAVSLVTRALDAADLRRQANALWSDASGKLQAWMEGRDPRTDRIEVPGLGKTTIVRSLGRKTFREDTLRAARPISRDDFVAWVTADPGTFRNPTEDVEALADALALDLEMFVKTGDPYAFVRLTDKRITGDLRDV